ncbi:MAG: hypothetical protein H6930_08695 [Rhodoferax sp.]|nr:hypothetical protein [Rhodoferax sp.]
MTALRNGLQFHEHPAVIGWWCRTFGRALVWLTPPARRRLLLAWAAAAVGLATTVSTMGKYPALALPGDGWRLALVVIAQFALLALFYRAAVGFARLPAPVRRHPQWALHATYWLMLVVLWITSPSSGLWRTLLLGVALLFPLLLWRLAYLMLAGQHGRMAGTSWRDHLMYLWPAWGGTDTPYGKGLAYLSQCEAKTTEALARSQLAGIRLLLLAVLWRLVLTAFNAVFHGDANWLGRALGGWTAGIPELQDLLQPGARTPWLWAWLSIYANLITDVLRLAVKGHLIVGFLRLYGFNVFRNTYKPLLAESIVEFWNRYYYYFKELLVTFFFMPTFTGPAKRLRHWPRLRLLAAVFAAAFVGNVYYHVIKESEALVQGQLWQVLDAQGPRMFYCLLLALGIYVSMLREQGRRGLAPQAGMARRVWRIAGVWTFFSLISIWNTGGGASFETRVRFFGSLWGLA